MERNHRCEEVRRRMAGGGEMVPAGRRGQRGGIHAPARGSHRRAEIMHIALLIRDFAPYKLRDTRWCGYFSYDVPEFTWDHRIVEPNAVIDRSTLTQYDLLVCEDETVCSFTGDGPPTAFLTWDGPLSREHYMAKRKQ